MHRISREWMLISVPGDAWGCVISLITLHECSRRHHYGQLPLKGLDKSRFMKAFLVYYSHFFIFIYCVCACMCTSLACVWRSDNGFHHWVWGSNSGCWFWLQAPLPSGPPHWPLVRALLVISSRTFFCLLFPWQEQQMLSLNCRAFQSPTSSFGSSLEKVGKPDSGRGVDVFSAGPIMATQLLSSASPLPLCSSSCVVHMP